MGSLFERKVIYDKTYGHVTYGCALCCAFTTTNLWSNPIDVAIGLTSPDGVNAYNTCAGYFEDVSDNFYNNWTVVQRL